MSFVFFGSEMVERKGEYGMFYDMLCEELNKAGWSLNYFSEKIGVNRGTLQRYKMNKALLPADKFKSVLDEMPLSSADREKLSECFFTEYYGEEKFNRIKHIKRLYSEINTSSSKNKIKEKMSKIDFSNGDYITVSTKSDAACAAVYMLENFRGGG